MHSLLRGWSLTLACRNATKAPGAKADHSTAAQAPLLVAMPGQSSVGCPLCMHVPVSCTASHPTAITANATDFDAARLMEGNLEVTLLSRTVTSE
jgi:hypothetical protein